MELVLCAMLIVAAMLQLISNIDWGEWVEWLRCSQINVLHDSSTAWKLPPQDESSNDECALCLECFHVGESVLTLTCGHTYHTNCITRRLSFTVFRSRSCPVCKADPLRSACGCLRGCVGGMRDRCSTSKQGSTCCNRGNTWNVMMV